jgi:hypothetical protein
MTAALLILRRWWPALVAALAVIGLIWWHNGEVADARKQGAAEQRRVDHEVVTAAQEAAAKAQAALVDKTATKAADISKGTDNALQRRYTDLARSYDDLRLRWKAHRADQSRAGQGGATGLASATGVPDDTYCSAQGWVSLDVAAAAAEAADTAIAKDDAWRGWYESQAAAWPR